jgi:hypothetical protein
MSDIPAKVSSNVRPNFQVRKFMFAIAWGIAGFHVINLIMSQRSFNREYFVNEIMQSLVTKLFPG